MSPVLHNFPMNAAADEAFHDVIDESDSEDSYETVQEGGEDAAASIPDFGCEHYRRKCKLIAPCCGEAFWCRSVTRPIACMHVKSQP